MRRSRVWAGILVTILLVSIVGTLSAPAPLAQSSPHTAGSGAQTLPQACQNASASLTKPNQTSGTFFYPWYGDDAHWSDQDHDPPDTWYANYTPDLVPGYQPEIELYNSTNRSVKRWQFEKMRQANIEVAISSWWGPGSRTDENFDTIVDEIMPSATNPHRNLKWAMYYEKEGPGYNSSDDFDDPPVDEIVDDIEYIKANYADSPYYYTINGSPVVYVYGEITDDGDLQEGENTTYPERWRRVKNQTDVHVVLKVNGDMAATEPGIDGWHQYAPANRLGTQPDSGYVSPGFTKPHPEDAPFLERNATEYETAINDLVDYDLSHLLVQTWNEYHEGTQIEPAQRVHHNDSGTFTPRNASYNDTYVDITGEAFADVVPAGLTAEISNSTERFNQSTVPITIEGSSPYDASYRAYLSVDDGQFQALGCDGTTSDGAGQFETNRTLTDGTHTLTTYVRDGDDDTSTDSNRSITVDTTPPETTLSTNRTLTDGWTNRSVEVTLQATDATTGVETTVVSVDGGPDTTYSGPITLSANGTHEISYYSTDELQNTEAVTNTTIGIDRGAPETTLSTNRTLTDGWTNGSVAVSLDATDSTSNVTETLVSVDGQPFSTYSEPITLAKSGTHIISYFSTDEVGNAASITNTTVGIDREAPETTLSTNRTLTDGWTNRSVEVTLDATDATTGVETTVLRRDGGAFDPYTGPVSLTANGTHELAYHSVDRLDNTEPTANATVGIDRGSPTIVNATASKRGDLTPGEAFTLTVEVADDQSGVHAVKTNETALREADGNWTATVEAPETTGNHTLSVAVTDTAGNRNGTTLNLTVTADDSGGPGLPPPPPESDPEPSLSVRETSLDTPEIDAGNSIAVTAVVANTGDAAGDRTLELALDGSVVGTRTVSVPAGERVEARLEHAIDEPGTYEVSVNGEAVGTVTVEEASAESPAETDENESESTPAGDGSDGGDGIPGFTPVAALVALVVLGVALRRQ
ncbi:OmpL47-type beta-barrel domain-containing protein [Halovivax cerinus]|uniref:OmpL47-type beta-barrel domain-containing protein n=1 Tax=Halovivax cerinus TaxID=1487865 RepID=A0ABD5NQQ4_9EURY|nr:Ig-like domain-containing protein [Halovivax cerinus]